MSDSGPEGTYNDDKRVLFDGEASRVDVKREPSEGHPPSRELFPCTADREDEELGHDVADGEGGLR